MTINKLLSNFQSLDTDKVAIESITETSMQRVELNREQLGNGLRSDGSEILPSYSPYTVQIKKLKGQESRFVTVKDTGAFWAGIRSDVNGLRIIDYSTDPKSDKLKKKYETSKGKLTGLNQDSKNEYIVKDLRPVFNNKISKLTGLKFK